MSRDFSRDLERVEVERVRRADDASREPSVRLYCTASPQSFGDEARWSLQLRGPVRLASGRRSEADGVATGTLSLQDLIELRDEAERCIRETDANREQLARSLRETSALRGGHRGHPFSPSRYSEICAGCGGHASDGVHETSPSDVSSRARTRDLRRPRKA